MCLNAKPHIIYVAIATGGLCYTLRFSCTCSVQLPCTDTIHTMICTQTVSGHEGAKSLPTWYFNFTGENAGHCGVLDSKLDTLIM